MKKSMIISAIMVLCCLAAHAQSYGVAVTNSSTVIVPSMVSYTAVPWTNNHVVAQGAYVTSTNAAAYTYWAVNYGTGTNMPVHTYGVSTGADGIEWLKLPNNGRRLNAIIFAEADKTVYYSNDGQDAVLLDGGILDNLRPERSFPVFQGKVTGIVATNALVTVQLEF